MDRKAVGLRIKQAREAKGLTQEQLAEKVALSASHISVIERGMKTPRLETFVDILNILKVDANSILTDVLVVSNQISSSLLHEKLSALPEMEQKKILKVLDALIQAASEKI
jgi:transcriptional regulator with XRE-family HTH domain